MGKIPIKTDEQIRHMIEGGKMLHEVLHMVAQSVRPGISTFELNELAENICRKRKITPSFKGYGGFPAAICTSTNNEVVHGIPSKKQILKEGDIISIDFGVFHEGLHTDSAITVPVGAISDEDTVLLTVTKKALDVGLSVIHEGATIGDIGAAIQNHVESNGFSVVRECIGHGVGATLHEPPEVPNYGNQGQGPVLKCNMTLAIEPIVNIGNHQVKTLSDQWTVATMDGKKSAHFEHTIVVLKDSCKIIT
jgi:methionyl aminopeptidase